MAATVSPEPSRAADVTFDGEAVCCCGAFSHGSISAALETCTFTRPSRPVSFAASSDPAMQPKRKKQRAATAASTSSFSIPLLRSHPCHVQPLGNFYLSSAPSCQPAGLGVLHSVLTEATLLHVLSYLSPYDLLVHGSAVSQAMYVYCREEELYRNAVLTTHGGDFRFAGTWRETWVWEELRMKYEDRENSKAQQPKQSAGRHSGMDARKRATHTLQLNRRFATPRIRGFYSDALFQSFYCSAVELTHFANADNIQRVSYTDLTPATYLTRFAIPNIPFIITDAVRTWPAARWTTDWLEAEYGDRPFKVGAYEMSMRDYMQYCRQSKDESPLYLFDSGFGDKYPRLVEEYTVPWCFKDDLFELLADMEAKEGYNDGCEDRETPGAHMQRSRAGTRSRTAREERKEECKEVELNRDGDTGPSKSKFGCMRPAFRWILIGPARSGSTFHKVSQLFHTTAASSMSPAPPFGRMLVSSSARPRWDMTVALRSTWSGYTLRWRR